MVDMKVQVYSKSNKNNLKNKLISPCSMREGRFHPPKCRGKVQKIGKETLKGLFKYCETHLHKKFQKI
jgi:hypothetical protein